ncbi:ATP-binding protein [Maribacter sp. BPC-D8]|uniref:ATP-binding protein n=1 Tax=Maribacter sp. BPC-D8 TaxID=3053613 RepID=UPI002B48CE7F|nr:ATP-binding protein [Maribacter sp. BPC-D8]WRI28813.1 ATP-binding protein [Maribacter sp. BPC-D8]
MNTDLAIVMMTNLIKNAIIHGQADKEIDIVIDADKITVRNYGAAPALDTNSLFKRFKKTSADSRSTGLGLAISKAIADKYQLQLLYTYSEKHNFTLIFPQLR